MIPRRRSDLREDQRFISRLIRTEPAKLIVAPMGRGKTGATLDALRLDQHHVAVPPDVAARARGSVDRMIALGPLAAARPGD